jgi:hypothetical protein
VVRIGEDHPMEGRQLKYAVLPSTCASPSHDAVNRYHTDPEAPLTGTATRSPGSKVAPSVVPVAENVVTAAEKASLDGASSAFSVMTKLPLLPPTPSTCRLYTLPCKNEKVTQLAGPGTPLAVQLSLLTTSVRAFSAVPV